MKYGRELMKDTVMIQKAVGEASKNCKKMDNCKKISLATQLSLAHRHFNNAVFRLAHETIATLAVDSTFAVQIQNSNGKGILSVASG